MAPIQLHRITATILFGLLFGLFLTPTISQAANESYCNSHSTGFSKNTSFSLNDPLYSQIGTGLFGDLQCKNRVTLSINLDDPTYQPDFYAMEVLVYIEYGDGTNSMDIDLDTLRVSYNPGGQTEFQSQSHLTFEDGHSVTVHVLDIISYDASGSYTHINSVPNQIELTTCMDIERYYAFDRQETSEITNVSLVGNKIRVDWQKILDPSNTYEVAESYDLEWVFVDDYSNGYYDFREGAVRVSLPKDSATFDIERVFKKGWLVFRVRGVGRSELNPEQPQEGQWSQAPISGTCNQAFDYCFKITTGHEPDMNWQFQATYAEYGKHKEVVSYFDGSLRGRQTVSKINQPDIGMGEVAVVGETIYDFEGRPAIQVLPVPAYEASQGSYSNRLGFYDNFNRGGSDPYSWEDFDLDMYANGTPPTSMDAASGASNYYSSANSTQDGPNAFIPNAVGYPFTQTEYTPDNTGRIRRQGGVGDNHQIGSSHETKYYYGVPSQQELNGLFGTEVGYAERYKKTLMVDPNGQASVTYVDAHGRTIATSLAGEAPDNLVELSANEDPIVVDLIGFNTLSQDGDAYTLNREHLVVADGTEHIFHYGLVGANYEDPCSIMGICYDCVYDITFTVQDEFGNFVINHQETFGPLAIDGNCNSAASPSDLNITEYLDQGNYTIIKTLKVNRAAAEAYADHYIANNACLKTEQDFIQEALANVDYSSCNEDFCSLTCLETWGSSLLEYQAITNNDLATTSDWEEALAECEAECYEIGANPCEAWLQVMKNDLRPGGQLALYTIDANGDVVPEPGTDQILSGSPAPYTSVSYGGLTAPNGQSPNNLSVAEFIIYFDDAWLDFMVDDLHPDWCFHNNWCNASSDGYDFDRVLMNVESMEEAVSLGWIDASNLGGSALFNPGGGTDPYFGPTGAGTPSEMASSLSNFNGFNYTLWDLAVIQVYCEASEIQQDIDDCLNSLHSGGVISFSQLDDCHLDELWFYIKAFYLGEKQKLMVDDYQSLTSSCSGSAIYGVTIDQILDQAGFEYNILINHNDPDNLPGILDNALVNTAGQICDGYEAYWQEKLQDCVSPVVLDSIISNFKAICECAQSSGDYPFGANEAPPGTNCTLNYQSFEEVLDIFLAPPHTSPALSNDINSSSFDPSCNVYQIQMPQGLNQSIIAVSDPMGDGAILDTCGCNKILAAKEAFETGPYPTNAIQNIEDMYASMYPGGMADIDGLICHCEAAFAADYGTQVQWSSGIPWGTSGFTHLVNLAIPVDPNMGCASCLTCEEIFTFANSLGASLIGSLETTSEGIMVLTSLFNEEFGMNLTWWDYKDFMETCGAQGFPLAGGTCNANTYLPDLVGFLDELAGNGRLYTDEWDVTGYSSFPVLTNYSGNNGYYEGGIVFRRGFQHPIDQFRVSENGDGAVGVGWKQEVLGSLYVTKLSGMDFEEEATVEIDLLGRFVVDAKPLQVSGGRTVILVVSELANEAFLSCVSLDNSFSSWGTAQTHYSFTSLDADPISVSNLEEASNGEVYADVSFSNEESITVRFNSSSASLINFNGIRWDYPSESSRGKTRTITGQNTHIASAVEPNLANNHELILRWYEHGTPFVNLLQERSYQLAVSPEALQDRVLAGRPDGGIYILIPELDNSVAVGAEGFTVIAISPGGEVEWSKSYELDASLNLVDPQYFIDSRDVDYFLNVGIATNTDGYARHLVIRILTGDGGGLSKGTPISTVSTDEVIFTDAYPDLESYDQDSVLMLYGLESLNGVHPRLWTIQNFGFDLPFGDVTLATVANTCTSYDVDVNWENATVTKDSSAFTISTITGTLQNVPSWPPSLLTTTDISLCPEKLGYKYWDGGDTYCTGELTMPNTAPESRFSNVTALSNPILMPDGTFKVLATLSFQGNTSQIFLTGTSSCLSPACQTGPTLCNQDLFPSVEPPSCKEYLEELAITQAKDDYQEYITAERSTFLDAYTQHCLDAVEETATMSYTRKEYQTTLYYYDQAGNLVHTVPPEGVVSNFNSSYTNQVDTDRENGVTNNRDHNFVTTYQYNSLGQLIQQTTPDAEGPADFWYDELGRQVLARNAKQEEDGTLYSYVLYDELGRTIEAGETAKTGGPPNALSTGSHYVAYSDFETWFNSSTQQEYVRTYYDESLSTQANNQFPGGQQHLRNRIASIEYVNPSAPVAYQNASHYSYDIRGNVTTLIHEFPELDALGHRFKRIDYDFDLISGNVNAVDYQPGQPDQFHYRYEYDANNRLTHTYSSLDSITFDLDAYYRYYWHGPLARVEIGEWQVQGMDYAYTIQGWLKGVNSSTLVTNRDMGKDGDSGSLYNGTAGVHQKVAQDAFGFTLGYFDGDYQAINTGLNDFEADPAAIYAAFTSGGQDERSLFNGNIALMQTALRDEATAALPEQLTLYHYDQLNRIREMRAFQNTNVQANNHWSGTTTSTNRYRTDYSYDKNGNLLTLDRYDQSGTQIDQFDYSYLIIGGDSTNRLDFVDDPIGSSGNDLADQNVGNYDYNEIGNLIEDTQGHIEEILWNNSNKIERIKFDNGDPTLEFRYDAGGNRVVKIVKPSLTDGTTWIYTYYVRDAQGNILAVYDRRHLTQEPLEPCETPVIGEGQLAPPPGLVSDPETGCWTDDWFDYEKLEFFKASEYHLYGSSRLGLWQANRYLTVAPSGSPECSYDLPYGYGPYADPDSADFCACDSCDQSCEEAYDIALAQYCQGDPNCELPPDWCAYNELTSDPCGCPPCIDVILDPETGAVVSSTPCDPCPCANWPVEPEFVLDGSESPHEKRYLTRGRKRYEGSNHLGNVLVVFSDRKLPLNSGGTVTGYQADVHAHSDYYPFGMTMEERTGSAEGYRFGFNGKESDDEVYGAKNSLDFGARVYDPRVGRWLSVDPLTHLAPSWTPYRFGFDNPVYWVDRDGNIEWPLRGNSVTNKSDHADGAWGLTNTVVRTSTYREIRSLGTSPHIGIDYRASIGTNIYSFGDGVVTDIGITNSGIKYIKVRYANGDVLRFIHLSSVAEGLEIGSAVLEGQVIAYSGNSGTYYSKKLGKRVNYHPHLHVDGEDRNGNPIDPEAANYGTVTNEEFFENYGGDHLALARAKEATAASTSESEDSSWSFGDLFSLPVRLKRSSSSETCQIRCNYTINTQTSPLRFFATSSGNQRAEIRSIPKGAQVYSTGNTVNGRMEVTYNGTTGWVNPIYLK